MIGGAASSRSAPPAAATPVAAVSPIVGSKPPRSLSRVSGPGLARHNGVTAPRRIVEGATFAICRRTERRRFLLRPDATFNALFVWLLAVFAKRFGIEVHAATCLSTHFHLVVTVPNADVSDFMHRLDMHLAKAVQVLRRFVGGVVWAPGALSIVELTTKRSRRRAADLRHREPREGGVGLPARGLARAQPRHRRHRPSGPDRVAAELLLHGRRLAADRVSAAHDAGVPRELGDDAARKLLEDELARQLAEARAYVKNKGWSVMGRIQAQNVSPYRCAKSWEELGNAPSPRRRRSGADRGPHRGDPGVGRVPMPAS